jgi:outer membrane protein OmpA-like peptidoglycan-associated protein
MELRGKYANSAPVQILAKLNPLAAKSYLDLKAEVTGVDLVGFSPYSGKYAGYAIEKGKLSLTVAYKLENNQLSAENRVFIDQFTFGDKIDSPDATKLPVNLAISLLKNNRGEIDLNLPISGSLDDPQFSIGGLIVKVIVNLFVKAVTSPFALLGSMFGSGDELSNIEFAAGRATLNDAAGKKLEALAKALNERNSLKLEITGRADPEADREGVKRAALERAMQAEKLKDLKKAGEGKSLEEIEIAPEERTAYLTRAYKEAKFPKPRNMVGLQKDLPAEEMEKLMLSNLPATDDDVKALAGRRAEAVQGWLVEQGKVPPERVFLLPPKVEADEKGKASRVDFSLK